MAIFTRAALGDFIEGLESGEITHMSHEDASGVLNDAQAYRTPLSEQVTRKLASFLSLDVAEGHEFTVVPYLGGYRTIIPRTGTLLPSESGDQTP